VRRSNISLNLDASIASLSCSFLALDVVAGARRGLIRALDTLRVKQRVEAHLVKLGKTDAELNDTIHGRSNNSLNLDASIECLSSALLTAYIEGCSSARVNSSVMCLLFGEG